MGPTDPHRFRLEQQQDVVAGLRPVAAAAVGVMLLFVPYDLIDLPAGRGVWVALHDVAVAALAAGLFWAVRGGRLRPALASPAASLFALALLSDVLHTMRAQGDLFYTLFVCAILVGLAGLGVAARWFFAVVAVSAGAWLAVALSFAGPVPVARHAFLFVACSLVAVTIRTARDRTLHRVLALRLQDAARQAELERALAVAEEARQTLDRRVAERTAELSRKTQELHRELDERQRDAREREELANQLLQAQKLESVGRLAGGVAHDLNNVLTVISGGIEEARGAAGLDPEAAEALGEAATAASRAAELTRQLLAFGRKQVIRPRVIDLGQIVEGLQKPLRSVLGERVQLTVAVAPGPPLTLLGDPGQLEQVVLNLAINASDAMPDGGALSIRVGVETLDGARDRGGVARPRGDFVVLAVADEGHGIAPEALPVIFEPFFTTKAPGQGTGLGLAVVHGVVSQNGGFIEVSSAEGRGTEFRLYLPRVAGEAAAEAAAAAAHTAASWLPKLGHATILLAEDEDALRNMAARALRRLGYEVLEARDGQHALQVATTHAGPIHLLITDVVMPNLDGRGLADRLKKLLPELPVLYASGYAEERIAHQGVLDEGVAFLPKPYTLASLAARARDMLKGAARPN